MGAYRQYHKHQAKNKRKPLESNQQIWRPWETPEAEPTRNVPIVHKFYCKFSDCDGTFGRENELRRHENSIHDRNTEFCTECPLQFTRKDNLTRHMKAKHTYKEKPSCFFCTKSLSRQDAVQRHMLKCPKNPNHQKVGVVKVVAKRRKIPRCEGNENINQENEM